MATAASRSLDTASISGFIFVFVILLVRVVVSFFDAGKGAEASRVMGVEFLHSYDWIFLLFTGPSSAVAGAAAAFRSYAELQVLANQSHHMMTVLERARRQIGRLDLDRPLASQDIGAAAANVATQILRDLEGWASLFRVKRVEPG